MDSKKFKKNVEAAAAKKGIKTAAELEATATKAGIPIGDWRKLMDPNNKAFKPTNGHITRMAGMLGVSDAVLRK